jgi:hypothetical protein
MRIHISLIASIIIASSYGQLVGNPRPLGDSVDIQSGTTVYDNRAGNTFTVGVRPARVLDDVVLSSGSTNFGCIEVGFNVALADSALQMEVQFYETVNYGVGAGVINTGPLGGFTVNLGSVSAGVFTTGLIDFTSLIPGGITVADGNLGIDVIFRNAANGNLSFTTTALFAGGGPTVGSSLDQYARDVNGNGQYDAGEGRFFNGPPNLANVYLRFAAASAVASLAGTIYLDGWSASPAGQAATLEFRTPSTTTVVHSYPIALDGSSQYSIASVATGTWDIAVKFPHWLRNKVTGMAINTGPNNVNLDVTNGDAVDDNSVDLGDLNEIFTNFAIVFDSADLDGSGTVDLPDLNVVFTNFAMTGVP